MLKRRQRTDANRREIVNLFRKANCRIYDISGIKGLPDLFGIHPNGLLFVVEVKNPKGRNRLSEEQKEFFEFTSGVKALAFVCRDADDVMTALQTIAEKAKRTNV